MGKNMAIAGAVAVAGVASAGASVYSGSKAADAQKSAAAQSTNVQENMFNKVQSNLEPYLQGGGQGLTDLTSRLNELTAPIKMDQATLEKTPGYQFTLNQGLKSLQNGYAARGLGLSGAALKGAQDYTTGLANNTYQTQFQNALNQNTSIYDKLMGLTSLGENAAAGVGNAGIETGKSIGSNLLYGGQAQGASYVNSANAVGSAANSGVSGLLTNKFLDQYGKNNSGSTGSEVGSEWASNPNTNWSSLVNGG